MRLANVGALILPFADIGSGTPTGSCFNCWEFDSSIGNHGACVPEAGATDDRTFKLECGLADFKVNVKSCVFGDIVMTSGGGAGECQFNSDGLLEGKYKDCGATTSVVDQRITQSLTLREVPNQWKIQQYPPVDLTCTLALDENYQFTVTTTVDFEDNEVSGDQTKGTVDPNTLFTIKHSQTAFVVGSDVTITFESMVELDDFRIEVIDCKVANTANDFTLVTNNVASTYVSGRFDHIGDWTWNSAVKKGELTNLKYRAFKFADDDSSGTHTVTCTLALRNGCVTGDSSTSPCAGGDKCYPNGPLDHECRA